MRGVGAVVVLLEVASAGGPAGGIKSEGRHQGARAQFGAAGGEGAGNHGVLRAVFGVGRAGKTDAFPATNAGVASAIRHRIEGERGRRGSPTCGRGPALQPVALGGTGQGRHRVGIGQPRGGRSVCGRRAGDSDFPFGPDVIRHQVVVAEGPIRERTALGHAVMRGHPKIEFVEPPGLHTPYARAAANTHGVVLVTAIMGGDDVFSALLIHIDARVSFEVGADVVAAAHHAMVAQVIPTNLVVGELASAFDHHHRVSGFGQDRCGNTATESRADD